uniref:SRP54-type proteins GTP-binding domain-containing protein n=1 Tax=Schistocephalus solidus TaxID=70667 RepID=A0A0X3Q3N9_SCHSO
MDILETLARIMIQSSRRLRVNRVLNKKLQGKCGPSPAQKSQKKTVASMIINKEEPVVIPPPEKKPELIKSKPSIDQLKSDLGIDPPLKRSDHASPRATVAAKMNKLSKKTKEKSSPTESPSSAKPGKRVKELRRWDNTATGAEAAALDYSTTKVNGNSTASGNDATTENELSLSPSEAKNLASLRGTLQEGFDELEVSSGEETEHESDDEETRENGDDQHQNTSSASSGSFMSSLLRGLKNTASGRALTRDDITPTLDHLRDHLVHKNVAFEIANRLCEGIAERLVGVQLGRFERVSTRVRAALEEACTRLLASGRRVDVLRDALDARASGKPYVIVFCGVNGVGKSTNLAKIAFWLIEKDLKVLIAACDTFRSGAVEQLRTHVHKLNYIHPPEQHDGETMVELFEKGYGKDAASIAMSAIAYAKDNRRDVVLVDTAGRMQDNEPLMRALAKLIMVNQPDLVLFVGEALVGNEAVDQLVKFNRSLANFSNMEKPHTIDGIVLTKFDTIDDKVGAAISMAYISGQPIVFVGTGQTYADLRQFSVAGVVKALMK